MPKRLTKQEKTRRIVRNRRQRIVGSFKLEGISLERIERRAAEVSPPNAPGVEERIQRLIALHAR